MKIKEITETFKITSSSPDKVEIASADGNTKITAPPSAIQQDPSKPNTSTLDLNNVNSSQSGQPQQTSQMGDHSGQPQQAGQAQLVPGQTPPEGQPAPIPGQQAVQQQSQLPKVGSEIELPDDIGSTMQSETVDDVDDKDLIASGHNKDISGDPTDKFINDVVDKEFEKHAGKSQRNIVQPNPIKESAELIAMLTIAGLR